MGPYHVRYDEMGKAYYWMSEDIAGWWLGDDRPNDLLEKNSV